MIRSIWLDSIGISAWELADYTVISASGLSDVDSGKNDENKETNLLT